MVFPAKGGMEDFIPIKSADSILQTGKGMFSVGMCLSNS